jgi:methylglutaconyl-CoA hydratase
MRLTDAYHERSSVMPDSIAIEHDGRIAGIRLRRPQVRNALDAATIGEITSAFRELAKDAALRVVTFEGEGSAFCGGADIAYMRGGLGLGEEENYNDALRLADMFAAIDECPVPVVAKVQGAALGGGSGIVAVCDIVIAATDALFGFTEVKLGIVPAIISPFVLRKIGGGQARALFVTGERFGAERALRIGLAHEVVPPQELDAALKRTVDEILSAGPQAVRLAKQIARSVSSMSGEAVRTWTARTTANRRASEEGQEGLRAFLDKRKPAWR